MPAKARCQITVRHYECDPLGHVNHAMYVHYFEVGRLTAMADAGLPFGAILKQGYTVVAVDIYVQYKAPAFTDDILAVESYITDFHGALMTWQQTIHRRADGALAAVAETVNRAAATASPTIRPVVVIFVFIFGLSILDVDHGRTPDSDHALHTELLNFPACCRSPDSYLFFILYYAELLVAPSLTSWRKLTVFCLVGFR